MERIDFYPTRIHEGYKLRAGQVFPFGDGTAAGMLELVEHKVTAKGTVIATYEPGGIIPPYPAEAPPPSTSEREAERQRRMAEGSW